VVCVGLTIKVPELALKFVPLMLMLVALVALQASTELPPDVIEGGVAVKDVILGPGAVTVTVACCTALKLPLVAVKV